MSGPDWCDAVVVGAGASGLLATYELLRRRPGTRVLLVDAGRSLEERQSYTTAELGGSGGAGIYLGGRLYLGPASIPVLPPASAPKEMVPVLEGEAYLARAREVDRIFQAFGATAEVRSEPSERLAQAVQEARAVGLEYIISYPARLLAVEERRAVLRRLLADLNRRGAVLAFGTQVATVERTDAGFQLVLAPVTGETLGAAHVQMQRVYTQCLILAPGRYGAEWLVQVASELGVRMIGLPPAFGVRVEVPAAAYRPLTEVNPDPRLHLMLAEDAVIKTYATCPGGLVAAVERYGRLVASGIPLPLSERGPNTTFAVLVQPGVQGAMGVWHAGAEYARILNERYPATLVAQRLGDLRRGKSTTHAELAVSALRPTCTVVTPGALDEVYPPAYWAAFDTLLGRIDQLAPDLCATDLLLYGPAEERFWHFPTDEHLQTSVAGLYVAGDGPGQSQGAVQAGVAGLLAGEGVAAALGG